MNSNVSKKGRYPALVGLTGRAAGCSPIFDRTPSPVFQAGECWLIDDVGSGP